MIAGLARPVGERPRLALLVIGLTSAALTRPHVSLLLAVSAMVFAAATLAPNYQSLVRRVTLLAAAVLRSARRLKAPVASHGLVSPGGGQGQRR